MTDSYYEVVVYTRDGCGPCAATKAYLRKYEINFAEINTTNNPMVADALIEQGYRELPVVEWNVNGDQGAWTGHRSDDLEALKYLIHG
ncbi:ribonucleoside-diphosphate reductase class Ib glutaredoxin subunit [Nocardia farcinica]|uniref:Glutaredoxin-like protein nrdH n=1 Tax=Nocardia farcinica TaxID=37329 RepID=A0A0H5PB62_NOCFR|nr:glutaredoxin domain-containing protein [Nocardia farcinica]AXK86562.1 NrdH-redoxin [Nocardia farcinica]PFW99031.1 Glutaredoxin-like protein NrdH [Nocardia farcinica]PFX06069.1 Glutaredoxin-like protein NrdH [Nocardia farcinica]CRY79841.1 Glutaredoxin-like protein nrdH [Nocardia farcinica]SIT33585.1 ribonucleoside-diphosphate reductase class Ib glutaredoxin subunit [Nocardia farcinica]